MSARELPATIGALASMVADAADTGSSESDLLAALDAAGELRHRVDALGVALTAACDAFRSDTGDTLAVRTGMRDLATLVTFRVGIDPAEASEWTTVASATAPRVSLVGNELPAAHPDVADALADGVLSVSGAAQICRTLDDVGVAVDTEVAAGLERTLVQHAPTLTARELRRLCRQVLDRCTPEDAELREETLRARSGLRISRLPDGSARWVITLHPEAEGLLRTALDARTAPRRAPTFSSEGEPADDDRRPLHQQRLDALLGIARTAIAADAGQVAGSPVTMLVTVDLETLRSELGTAQIAGIDAPISAGTARRLAADAEIIPVVLGTTGEPLDLGRRVRIATPAQRRALVLRDGGCVRCGSPPGWCEVAHRIPWYLGGRTDLEDLVLLCPPCHRIFDRDGWELVRRDGVPWFIPPPHIDSTRTPRRGHAPPRIPVGV